MMKDKQTEIEEMVKDLDEIYNTDFKGDYESGLKDMASRLFAKGYRKSTDIAEEIFAEIEKSIANLEYQANTPRKTVKVEELKAQCNWILHEVIPNTLAELKKKYIGKDTNVTTKESEKENGNI